MTIKQQMNHIARGFGYGFSGACFGALIGGLGQYENAVYFSLRHAIGCACMCFVIGFLAYCFEYVITRNHD